MSTQKEHGTWHLYVLRCGDGTLYTGIALDVRARLRAHRAGKGARYTRGRGPLRLLHQEPAGTKGAALRLEAQVKALPRAKKLEWIRQRKRQNAASV